MPDDKCVISLLKSNRQMTIHDFNLQLLAEHSQYYSTAFVDVMKRVTTVSDDVRASRVDACESLPLLLRGTADWTRQQTGSCVLMIVQSPPCTPSRRLQTDNRRYTQDILADR